MTFKYMHRFLIIIICLHVIACKKKTKNTTLNENFDINGATFISRANFSSNAHTTNGCVSLYTKNATKNLVFEGFKTDNGPDLRVYLSKTTSNTDFIEAGSLKATSGNFYYSIDTSINTTNYKYILIWCKDYSVLFGNAQLK